MFTRIAFGLLVVLLATADAGAVEDAPLASGDPAHGEEIFQKRCRNCHSLDPDDNKNGPAIRAVIGRAAGTAPGYKYSHGYVEAGRRGIAWTPDHLFDYLEHPTKFIRHAIDNPKARTKMVFRLRKANDRADITAYLRTLAP